MNKLLLNGVAIVAFMMMLASCQYKYVVEPVVPPPTEPMSLEMDIEPIWSDQGCIGCHNTGGQQPDLTAGNSYGSLTGTGLYDTEDPESSKIYYYPLPDGSHYVKYTSAQADLVLLWIQEGALDN